MDDETTDEHEELLDTFAFKSNETIDNYIQEHKVDLSYQNYILMKILSNREGTEFFRHIVDKYNVDVHANNETILVHCAFLTNIVMIDFLIKHYKCNHKRLTPILRNSVIDKYLQDNNFDVEK